MKYISLILFTLLSVFFNKNVFSDEKIISELQKGGKIIFIRHALAPGNGDPENFDINDCKTQRNLNNIGIEQSKKIEKESNQILDFTKEIKKMKENEKIKIIETLWKIIYSNKDEDMYESNLMRRLSGLLYIDYKIMGNIKEKIKKEYLK